MTATLHRHAAGITWTEETPTARSSHALAVDGQVWLVDPFEDPQALEAARELGAPAGVVQLLDRHNRDCALLAGRLGVTLHRVPAALASPLEVVAVIDRPGWHEAALWWPAGRVLVVAEAVGTAPAFTFGRRAGVHPILRLTPPRGALGRFDPALLLVGHGPPLLGGDAGSALAEALARARSDIPRLLGMLPDMLRRSR